MSERAWQEVPAEIDSMPAGAALCAALERVDPSRVSAHDTMRLLAAHRRQLAHQQAGFHASLLQAALADPVVPGERRDEVGRFDADELRMVLSESATAIHTMLRRAEFAGARPIVADAWGEGSVERERVRILETWTEGLSDEHRTAVLEIAVPEAGGLTQKDLIDRVEQLARDLDPDWAKKRYENHKRQRRVRARRTEAGTANLSGLDLGLDDTALAERNVAVMAKRAKALGHPGLLDTIEADIYVALLKPRPPGHSDDDVIDAVVAAADPADPHDPWPAPDPGEAPPEPDPRPDGTDPTTAAYPDDDREDDRENGPNTGPATGGPTDPTGSPGGSAGVPGPTPRRKSGIRWPRRAKLGLRVGLFTLLGLDRSTARMPGYGVVHAEMARQLTRDWADAEWRLALQDDTGALSTVLVVLERPSGWATVPTNPDGTPRHPGAYHPATGQPARSPVPPRELVVIHATEEQLAQLPLSDHPAWADLLADARRQALYWRRDVPRRQAAGTPTDDLGVRLRGHEDLAGLLTDLAGPTPTTDPIDDPIDDAIGDPTGDATADRNARFPSAAQRRWVSERNQTCVFPACGADAVHCDTDHTRPHRDHGPTLSWNLGPACPHDNQLKEQPGWWVEQPHPGHFRWHSNTGHTYPATPTGPVPDHPRPRRFDPPSSTTPHEYAGHDGAWTNDPYPADTGPLGRRAEDVIDRLRGRVRSSARSASTRAPTSSASGPAPPSRAYVNDDPPPF